MSTKKGRFIGHKKYWDKLKLDHPDLTEDELFNIYKKDVTSKSKFEYFLAKNDCDVENAKRDFESFKKLPKINSLDWFINKYGKDLGIEKYKSFKKLCSYRATLEGFINRYGEVDGIAKFNSMKSNREGSQTLDGYIKKYGKEKGEEKYRSWIDKFSYKNSKKRYIEEFGEDLGLKMYEEISKKKSSTLKNYTTKYGEEEGRLRYNSWKDSNPRTLEDHINRYGIDKGKEIFNKKISGILSHKKKVSNISKKFFEKISEYFPNNSFMYGDNEKSITISGKKFFVDFYDPETKFAVEFFGDYWHLNANKDFKNKTFDDYLERFNQDLLRLELIQNSEEVEGIIEVVWESDFKNFPDKEIFRIINLIKSRKI